MNDSIGQKLRLLRKEKRMTQQELADALQIKRATISNYEIGRRSPHLSELRRIAEYFGVGLDYFGMVELHAIEQTRKHHVTRESIEETIRAMIAEVETGNEEVIKTVFDRIVDRIEIDNDKVTVFLVIAFSPFAHNRALSNSKYAISAKINRSELQ